jgi:glucosamine--fructose-6-phosphate aminotransferase (isomerizing)
MAALTCFALELASAVGRSAEVAHIVSGFEVVPDLMQQTLLQHDEAIAALADREAGRSVYLYAGGGPSFASALFGAAKVKECSPDHAIAIQLEEFHHYNSQKRGDPLFLIAPQGPSVPRSLDTVKEGKRWGGSVYSIATEGDRTLAEVSDSLFPVPKIAEELSVFVTAVPVQLFAYHVAMAKFRNAEREAAQ